MQILALGHKSRVGKDTLTRFILSHLKLNSKNLRIGRVSFAAKLKAICYDLYKDKGLKTEEFYNKEENASLRYIPLSRLNMSPVQIWIEVGNKLRDVYIHTWVDYAMEQAKMLDIAIITDLRFPSEFEAIEGNGGICIRVDNPNAPILDSESDRALDGWSRWHGMVMNDGSLNDLHTKAEQLCEKYLNYTDISADRVISTEPFSRSACIFNYCPTPALCGTACQSKR